MSPTLADGTLLAIGPASGPLRRGQLVLVRRPAASGSASGSPPAAPPMELVKRVVGLPRERVLLTGGGLEVDGRRVAEPYLPPGRRDPVPVEVRLGPGEYLVLGDRRDASTDGRSFGPIGHDDVIGLVRFVYWPPSAWRPIRVIKRLGVSTVSRALRAGSRLARSN